MMLNFTRKSTQTPRKSWYGAWLLLATIGLFASGLPAYAVSREISITAPATATAGSKVTITVAARTDAGSGEHVGFFHSDYSVDNGVTWTAISYALNTGLKASYSATFAVKEAGSKALVRVRVAFRGGKAGDVDYVGKAIEWDGSWNKWKEPPAKIQTISVIAK